MATKLHDVPAAAGFKIGLLPGDYTDETANGPTADLIAADGRGFAAFAVGPFTNGTVTGRVQESADGSSWATVATVAAAASAVAAVAFDRTKRYVRAAVDVAGTDDPVPIGAVIGQQLKTI